MAEYRSETCRWRGKISASLKNGVLTIGFLSFQTIREQISTPFNKALIWIKICLATSGYKTSLSWPVLFLTLREIKMGKRFHDRADAGRKLAEALTRYKTLNPVILALPRGGVPVAAEIANEFQAPLDIILVRKIGAPIQPELALGAVVDGNKPVIVRNREIIESTATDEDTFASLCRDELQEIERRRKVYVNERASPELLGRVVIVVDDGIATGATARAALRALRARRPKKLVLAVPVAPASSLEELKEEADDVVCLTDMGLAGAIGFFYQDFRQLTDKEVVDILARFRTSTSEPVQAGR